MILELSVWEHDRGKKGPGVESSADPGRENFDPYWCHVGVKMGQVTVWMVPRGEGHHNVERCQAEHEVEKAVRVRHAVLLVVPSFPSLDII